MQIPQNDGVLSMLRYSQSLGEPRRSDHHNIRTSNFYVCERCFCRSRSSFLLRRERTLVKTALEDKTYEEARILRKWCNVFRITLEHDCEEAASTIVQIARSPVTREHILSLQGIALLNVLGLTQGVSSL